MDDNIYPSEKIAIHNKFAFFIYNLPSSNRTSIFGTNKNV